MPAVFMRAVACAINEARDRPPPAFDSPMHETVFKNCGDRHAAANGAPKTAGEAFDDRGLMALVCRHDIPVFICNIITAGEQSLHPITLFLWLLLHLPRSLTMTSSYDINCQMWRTLMSVSHSLSRAHFIRLTTCS